MFFQNSLDGYMYLIKENLKNKKIMSIYLIGSLIIAIILYGFINLYFGSIDNLKIMFINDIPIFGDSFLSLKPVMYMLIIFLFMTSYFYIFMVIQNNETLKIIGEKRGIKYKKLTLKMALKIDTLFFMTIFGGFFLLGMVMGMLGDEGALLSLFLIILGMIFSMYIITRLFLYKASYCLGESEKCFKDSWSTTKGKFWILVGIIFVASTVTSILTQIIMVLLMGLTFISNVFILFISLIYIFNITIYTLLPIAVYYSFIKKEKIGDILKKS